MDSQLKTLGIRLSDIWQSCQTEMTEMNGKIKRLGDCLLTSDVIISHLTKTNETLVEIIEKCGLNARNNPEVIALAQKVSKLEKYIDREKDNLMIIKKSLKNSNNGNKVVDLIYKWDKCVKMRDKCIQTTEELFNTNIECNSHFVAKSKPIDEKSGDMKNSLSIDIDCESDVSFGAQDMAADDCNDSDYEVMSNTNKKLQTNNRFKAKIEDKMNTLIAAKSNTNQIYRQTIKQKSLNGSNDKKFSSDDEKLMDILILPEHKQDNHYVCNETDCHFQTSLKYRLYCHLKRHQISGLSVRNFLRQEMVDDIVIPLWDPIIKTYVCDGTNCLVSMTNKHRFYYHVIKHKTSGTDDHRQEYESMAKQQTSINNNNDDESDVSFKAQEVTGDDSNDSDFEVMSNRRRSKRIKTKRRDKVVNQMVDTVVDDNVVNESKDLNGLTAKQKRVRYDRTHDRRRRQALNRLVLPMRDHKLQTYVCNYKDCRFKLSEKWTFFRHLRGHQIKLDYNDSRDNSLIQPEHLQDDQYVCTETDCQFRTPIKYRFQLHLRRHRTSITGTKSYRYRERVDDLVIPLWDPIKKLYVCNWTDCTAEISNKGKFYKHMKQHIPLPQHSSFTRYHQNMNKYKVDDQYVCDEVGCDFTSVVKAVFYRHRRQHNPIPVRESKSTKRFDLSLPRPYVCEWPGCSVACKKNCDLSRHIKRVHKKIRNMVCNWPGCDYRTYHTTTLKIHHQRHTKQKDRLCTWPGCEYRCIDEGSMVSHMRKHTGEKPYSCPYPECGFRCAQSCSLKSHIHRHTGEKPYVCTTDGCGKRFSALSGLYIHRKSHHK